jgi:hypothetical protein
MTDCAEENIVFVVSAWFLPRPGDGKVMQEGNGGQAK